jgi:hypothetical protein
MKIVMMRCGCNCNVIFVNVMISEKDDSAEIGTTSRGVKKSEKSLNVVFEMEINTV